MPTDGVRPFRRSDRDQLTQLVNAHAQAVVPGAAVSVNAVLSQLEHESGEFLVEPWVTERATLVVEQRGRVTAAAFLVRYGAGEQVGPELRDVGEIRWLLCWPDAPFWPDSSEAGRLVADAALATAHRWGVRRVVAGGSLPVPGVYGLPEQWPHVREVIGRAGFVRGPRTEVVLLADVDRLRRAAADPDLAVTRTVGVSGTRLSARSCGEIVGYIEVDTAVAGTGRISGPAGWADIGNLHVAEAHRRRGVGRRLVAHAADWLNLARIDRLLAYATPDDTALLGLLESTGFVRLTETAREWTLDR